MLVLARRCRVAVAVAVAGVSLLAGAPPEPGVTKITITSTISAFDGRAFGDVGDDEQTGGTATGELDPFDPRNALLTEDGCGANGFENFEKIAFWRTPVAKCETQSAGCVPYYRWVTDYIAILGGR